MLNFLIAAMIIVIIKHITHVNICLETSYTKCRFMCGFGISNLTEDKSYVDKKAPWELKAEVLDWNILHSNN